MNVRLLTLGGCGHCLRRNWWNQQALERVPLSVGLRPGAGGGGGLGKVWGSQPHPVMAKLRPRQIFTEFALSARHGDTVLYFRDKNSYLGRR